MKCHTWNLRCGNNLEDPLFTQLKIKDYTMFKVISEDYVCFKNNSGLREFKLSIEKHRCLEPYETGYIFFVREKVLNQSLLVSHISSQDQVADLISLPNPSLSFDFVDSRTNSGILELVASMLELILLFLPMDAVTPSTKPLIELTTASTLSIKLNSGNHHTWHIQILKPMTFLAMLLAKPLVLSLFLVLVMKLCPVQHILS
ncbi:hypothetical protein CR513_48133, partial [Mucuna pruriens]